MPLNRFFTEKPLQIGDIVSLEGDEFHHLVHATRKRAGETLELINGKGILAEGILSEIKKNTAYISITSVNAEEKKVPRVILIQAIPRMNRLDTIIEKATELGAASIYLFAGEHSERKDLSAATSFRLTKIAQSAIKQSGHLYLPEITVFPSLKECLSLECSLFFGDIDPDAPLMIDALLDCRVNAPIAIVIGPESGLSASEEELLKAKGAIGVKLAEAILRTDTAPIVALGIIAQAISKKLK